MASNAGPSRFDGSESSCRSHHDLVDRSGGGRDFSGQLPVGPRRLGQLGETTHLGLGVEIDDRHDHVAEPAAHVGRLIEHGASAFLEPGHGLAVGVGRRRREERLLRGPVAHEQSRAHAGPAGDLGGGGALVAELDETVDGGPEQRRHGGRTAAGTATGRWCRRLDSNHK